MKKFALGIQYDGSAYHGWQRQKTVLSVQEEIEKSLSIIANHNVEVVCAGRTDAGVHSIGQVIHFTTLSIRKTSAWTIGVNRYLSKYISVVWVREVKKDFHARFSALTRSYRYIIYNALYRSSILHGKLNHVYKKLDEKRMNDAAQYLIGEHDFTSFRSINCQSYSPFRQITHLSVQRFYNWIILDITANSFLHHMVRNIVGSLIEVGTFQKNICWIKEILEKKNRKYAGHTASPKGLYLLHVEYPDYFNLPKLNNNFIFF